MPMILREKASGLNPKKEANRSNRSIDSNSRYDMILFNTFQHDLFIFIALDVQRSALCRGRKLNDIPTGEPAEVEGDHAATW